MALTGPQVKQIQQASLDGYSLDTLRMIMRIELGENLEAIAGPGALSTVAFVLIEWAERTGRVQELINGALAQQPGNALIRALHEQSKGWGLVTPGGRSTPAEAGQSGPGAVFGQQNQRVDTQTNVAKANDVVHGDKTGGDKVGGNKYTAEHITIIQGSASEMRAVPDVSPPAKAPPIEFEWVKVRAGAFFMGDKELEGHGKQHVVRVSAFEISRYLVTNAQYVEFVDATGHRVPAHWLHGVIPKGKENHPVVKVDWYDALEFCGWAGVRLPTEAEWEKAGRGTDGRLYPWGNEAPTARLCNFGMQVGDTTPVDKYPEGVSPYGVDNMAGNVLEWTSSGVDPYPYRSDDGRENLAHPHMIFNRIARGGSFLAMDTEHVRCTWRWPLNTRNLWHDAGDPLSTKDVPAGIDLGFRVVRST